MPFVNIQDEARGGKTALHLAVEAECYASASHLLCAGGYEIKPNGAAFTPAIEELFGEEDVEEITVHLVKGLIRKAKMKLVRSDHTISALKMKRPEGGPLLSLVEESSWWEELAAAEGVGYKIANFASRMPTEFSEWLLTKASEEEDWNKRVVHDNLMDENIDGKSSYDRLNLVDMDSSGWNKVAAGVGENIAQLAATLPREFSEWLLIKTEEENWDKTTVHNGLCQVNKEGKTAISLLDLAMPMWTRLSMWAKKGLQLRVENKDLGEALKIWHKSTLDPDVGEERAVSYTHLRAHET